MAIFGWLILVALSIYATLGIYFVIVISAFSGKLQRKELTFVLLTAATLWAVAIWQFPFVVTMK